MTITYDDFKAKYTGKLVDANGNVPGQGAYGQCVDITNLYIKEVLGLPIVLGTNAVDFPKKCLSPNYEYILNTPTAVPIQGDIMIYKSPDGIGHIDIFDNGNTSKFVAFSQNWPLKSVCKLVNHTYTGTYSVVGWLRKNSSIIDDMTDEQKRILEFLNGKTEGDVREAFGALAEKPVKDEQIQTFLSKVLSLDKFVKELEDRIVALESDLQANLDLVKDWQSKYNTANKQIENKTKEIEDMTIEKNKYKGYYETALKDQVNKYTGWQLIKLGVNKIISSKK
jgi:hypothetical protein